MKYDSASQSYIAMVTEQESLKAFQAKTRNHLSNILQHVPGFTPTKSMAQEDSYPILATCHMGDSSTMRRWNVSAQPKDGKTLVMFDADVDTSNHMFRNGSEELHNKHIDYANSLADHLKKIPGAEVEVKIKSPRETYSSNRGKYSTPSVRLMVDTPMNDSVTTNTVPQKYDPLSRYMNTPGQQAKSNRIARVGPEFRDSYGGDASNYRF